MSEQITEWIARETRRVMTIRADAIEAACEKALQGGTCGVLVIEETPTEWLIGPHPSVPYGQIHYAPAGYEPPAA